MKRILALIMAMALIFTFTACEEEKKAEERGSAEFGGSSEEVAVEEDLTAEEVIERTIKETEKVKTVCGKIESISDIEIMGEKVDQKMIASVKNDIENGFTYMDVKMTTGGTAVDFEIYQDSDGKNAEIYTKTQGLWFKQSISKEDVSKLGVGFDGLDGTLAYLENTEDAELEKEGSYYIIKGKTNKSFTENFLKETVKQVLASEEIPAEIYDIIFANISGIELEMYIDSETFLISTVKMDMRKTMESLYVNIATIATIGGETYTYNVSEVTGLLEFYDYNKPVNITIPEEAKNAQEMPVA